ncbi:B/F/G family RNA polymerase sigma-70 factor [Streptomyces cinnamoneus]|uniref:B/F/G family RNA polymerase sigma-70 factor n=1 Tax=Streptomyces cinnamoneus TaxID=53446 RepID=A0A2G1XNS7_STRCJ|nr:SigB/SigF/SigG family RNA polymerase sigma factor [Streptomyces cinnamoneus]PHQ52888.1 B/F/G family RNA polymerase sigma-70 factor [Streptomyces cinnamoneus]PPT11453.1 SigB/SigF/SigG family RNA polymerase sigma factor [Streptomyces cinnamoneus]
MTSISAAKPATAEPSGTDKSEPLEGALPLLEDAGSVDPKDARALTKIFLDRLGALEEGTHEYQYVRNTLIEMNLSLVRFVAGRFRTRAEQMEDIVQVGTIGLIKAIDRFDLMREVEFTTFAIPYVTGEIKRFFRDTSWAVHVPRRLQELRVELAKATDELSGHLGRSPSVRELAEVMDLSEEEIIEAQIASNGYRANSLDMRAESAPHHQLSSRSWDERIGTVDENLEKVENLHVLKRLLPELDDRERRILGMRFGQEMTQSQIGAELGISQMHVSRLLSRTLGRLRTHMLAEQ